MEGGRKVVLPVFGEAPCVALLKVVIEVEQGREERHVHWVGYDAEVHLPLLQPIAAGTSAIISAQASAHVLSKAHVCIDLLPTPTATFTFHTFQPWTAHASITPHFEVVGSVHLAFSHSHSGSPAAIHCFAFVPRSAVKFSHISRA